MFASALHAKRPQFHVFFEQITALTHKCVDLLSHEAHSAASTVAHICFIPFFRVNIATVAILMQPARVKYVS